MGHPVSPGPTPVASRAPWYRNVYRRFSVDIHIPDWHPDLMRRFDPATYVGHMARAGIQSLLQYTNSHVGLCLWRTAVGKRHAAMGDRDWFGEVVSACRKHAIHPLAYFSVVYDNWAFEHHPGWRFRPADGQKSIRNSRYGLVCPNTPYRDYVLSCAREIASTYDLDGFFFDMTFWPGRPCYCPACVRRFRAEHHADPPRIVDWNNPLWRAFQQARERWLAEFAMACTNTVRAARPGITVNHQFSTVVLPWTLGVPLELREACDYVGGDFYGGPLQHSLACKLYDSLSLHHPFEFHTSRTRSGSDHVTAKSAEELRTECGVATLHHAALMLIDYLNADGTLNPGVYDVLGALNRERAAYEPFLGGKLLADVAILFDKPSLYDPAQNGWAVSRFNWGSAGPHLDAVVGAARVLQEAHIPFGVVTNATLDQLDRYRALWIPNVLALSKRGAAAVRAFVRKGGSLYCSGNPAGLEDVLGVKACGTLGTGMTYLTPRDPALAAALRPQDHLAFAGAMPAVKPGRGASVPATVTLPFVNPGEGKAIGSRFAAIHSHPPALRTTGSPAVVESRFGRGRVLWTAAPFEVRNESANTALVRNLLRRILRPPFCFEADTHPAVEVTLFEQVPGHRWVVGLLNLQQARPQVAVPATVRVRVPERRGRIRVHAIPTGRAVPVHRAGPYVEFHVKPFTALAMFRIEAK